MNLNKLKQLVRESALAGHAYVAWQRFQQRSIPSDRTVIFFPLQLYTGTGGDLRCVAVARELRAFGWKAIVFPPWLNLAARQTLLRKEPQAILYFHKCRHELNLPALYPGHRSIFDADDADIVHDGERFITALRSSTAVVAGSTYLAELFAPYNSNVTVIWTGTYLTTVSSDQPPPAKPIIAWAASNPFDYPEESAMMLTLWQRLARQGIQFTVAVYSNDRARAEQWLAPLTQLGVELSIRPRMRYLDFARSLANVTIGLHPVSSTSSFSKGKSFGKVLVYMAANVPIIASDEIDHRLFFRSGENGILVDTLDEWIAACTWLLDDPAARTRIAAAAHTGLLARLTSRRHAELLNQLLETLSPPPQPQTLNSGLKTQNSRSSLP